MKPHELIAQANQVAAAETTQGAGLEQATQAAHALWEAVHVNSTDIGNGNSVSQRAFPDHVAVSDGLEVVLTPHASIFRRGQQTTLGRDLEGNFVVGNRYIRPSSEGQGDYTVIRVTERRTLNAAGTAEMFEEEGRMLQIDGTKRFVAGNRGNGQAPEVATMPMPPTTENGFVQIGNHLQEIQNGKPETHRRNVLLEKIWPRAGRLAGKKSLGRQ
ncbi:MAG TPA: hypothetical protein VD735_03035 [Candidatus Saccharimonadales bacterium]|nr:hypothetical protein [Candidatus Saccharimonadales bacterium]